MKKWKMMRMIDTGFHGSDMRRVKNGVSSGRLAIQISMNCEKPMYVQKQVIANISLPTLCECSGVTSGP